MFRSWMTLKLRDHIDRSAGISVFFSQPPQAYW